MKKIVYFAFLTLSFAVCSSPTSQPKLIVQIVVDQLRGDLIEKHQSQFGKEGFNYLLTHGIDFHNAHQPHANTTTCAGHASIATGSYPSLHGIIDNEWFDRDSKQPMYCVEDTAAKILTTKHTKTIITGRSPKNLSQSTLSDEIILAKKGRAFSVSFKDRAAITLAGHAGKAIWFDKTNGGFVSSDYYYSSYPKWLEEWNNHYQPQGFDWQLSLNNTTYQNRNNKAFKHDYGSFGQTFPHHIANPPSEEYFKGLSRTPNGDKLTAEVAELLLKNENLGKSEQQTDYLAVSFSSVDAIGHQFGPNSLEAEDNILQLDKTLAHFFAAIDQQVGLNNTLIILTADHGVSNSPAYLQAHGMAEIKPVKTEAITQFINDYLKQQFKLPAQTLLSISPPFVYLDHKIIQDQRLDLHEVTSSLAEALTLQPGIFKAYRLPMRGQFRDWLSSKVNKMYFPYRSGDIYLVPPPYQSYGAKNDDRVSHGSPWQYDSFVPLIFARGNFAAQRIARPVYSTDIAATLAEILLIKSPTGSVGKPLNEVLQANKQGE